jgi:serine protease inhibitor
VKGNAPAEFPVEMSTLNLVNSVWAERTFTLLPSYLDTLALSYGAPVRLVDFVNAPEPARVTMPSSSSLPSPRRSQ